jgi:hypothetical protein
MALLVSEGSCLGSSDTLMYGRATCIAALEVYPQLDWIHDLAPDVRTLRSMDAAAIGGGPRLGWLDVFPADLHAAKAVEGPRNDWRFFFVLAAKY